MIGNVTTVLGLCPFLCKKDSKKLPFPTVQAGAKEAHAYPLTKSMKFKAKNPNNAMAGTLFKLDGEKYPEICAMEVIFFENEIFIIFFNRFYQKRSRYGPQKNQL